MDGHVYNSISFLSSEETLTTPDKVDPTRGTMVCNHFNQTVILENAEFPKFFTGYENEIGKANYTYKKHLGKNNLKIVDKIAKSKYVNFVITETIDDSGNPFYDVIHHDYAKKITESYGYVSKLNTKVVPGAELPNDTVLYKSTQYDRNMNFCYGVNLKTAYTNWKNLTLEDTIVISKSAAKKFRSYDVNVVDVMLNTNDILINLYGNDTNYKCIPNVGEDVVKSLLCSRRRVDFNSLLYSFKNDNLCEVSESDTLFYVSGTVVDVAIYSNNGDDIPNSQYNTQINDLLKKQNSFYSKCIAKMETILNTTKNVSQDFLFWYNRYKNCLTKKWQYNDTVFDNMLIQITVLSVNEQTEGGKITNRYGSKGINIILGDDEDMPVLEDGTVVEAIVNPLSVMQRKNIGQSYELELTHAGNKIAEKMKVLYDVQNYNECEKLLFKFLTIVNKRYSEQMHSMYNKLTPEKKILILRETTERGVYIKSEPFFSGISFDTMEEIYDTFPFIHPDKVVGMVNPLIVGDMYFIKLKHTAISKYTVRSTGSLSLRDSPAKGKEGYKTKFPKTPIRLGEMENNYLGLLDIKTIVDLLRAYSTSSESRDSLHQYLLDNNIPYLINNYRPEEVSEDSNIKKILQSLLRSVSLEITF